MNRRLAAIAILAGLSLAAGGCAQVNPSDPRTPTPTPSASEDASPADPEATELGFTCQELAASLPLAEQASQLVMIGVTDSLDDTERTAITEGKFGSVIIMGNGSTSLADVGALSDEIVSLADPETGMIVATDQEGGAVQRLRGPGFNRMPAASDQAALTTEELVARASEWGGQLAAAGIHLDLAPVADVVPAGKVGTNEPIGKLGRGYGSDPQEAAEKVRAFIQGMHQAGVGTSAKHFPNLGEVVANTDFAEGVVDDVTTANAEALAPFKAAIDEGTETVMMSTATYTQLDPDNQAAFSPTIIRMLRDELGFTGVVISDDMGAAASVKGIPAHERALRFVRAGGDLAISVDVASAQAMAEGLAAVAEADPATADLVTASAGRVLSMKASLGAAACEPVFG